MLSTFGRAAYKTAGVEASQSTIKRALQCTWQLQRVSIDKTSRYNTSESQFTFSLLRSYATTSRGTQTPKPTAKKTTISKSATAKKSTAKKTAKKPAKQATKSKGKAGRPKAKVVRRKPITEEQKAKIEAKKAKQKAKLEESRTKEKNKQLKEAALLNGPKSGARNAYTVYVQEKINEFDGPIVDKMRQAAQAFKELRPDEREHYNHSFTEKKAAHETAYKKWVQSHTPDQIRVANIARQALKRQAPKGSSKFGQIEDPRLPKKAVPALFLFQQDRWASGDMQGIPVVDAAKQITKEYNALSASEKKKWEDMAAAEKLRYEQEYKTVYHRDMPAVAARAA